MRRGLLIICLVLSSFIYVFSNVVSLEGDGFGVTESKKGYLTLYLIDKDGNKTSVLDPGLFLNSRIYLKDSDRRFYLRDHGQYVITTTKETLAIKWRMDTLEVLETYLKTDTGFKYDIKLKNRTNKDHSIGLYLMFDTYLGEQDSDHFIVDNDKVIKHERVYSGSDIPESVISKNSKNQAVEFRFIDSKNNKPDQLILGNWDQLAYSKKWPYKPNDGGMFSYGYYSINDSAIGVVYNGGRVGSGESILYSFDINFLIDRDIVENSERDLEDTKKKKWINVERADDLDAKESPVKQLDGENLIPEDTSLIDSVNDDVVMESVPNEISDVELIDDTPSSIESTTYSDKEELLKMLEYIQKKKRGEDVSEYDFDEEYILEKLKRRNE